jgi:hypothetical protein
MSLLTTAGTPPLGRKVANASGSIVLAGLISNDSVRMSVAITIGPLLRRRVRPALAEHCPHAKFDDAKRLAAP